MTKLALLEAEDGIAQIIGKVQGADREVSRAIQRFVDQVNILSNILGTSSLDLQLLNDIIETSKLPENAGSPTWISMGERANIVKTEITERSEKYQAALPTIATLRNS